MKTLLKNAKVVNVFTESVDLTNVLIEDDRIVGLGTYYTDADADVVEDLGGKYVCPGFIDGHIHIESTTVVPEIFAKESLKHGTTAIVTDPHEIANVMGVDGIKYMLEATEGLLLDTFFMIPSCVPSCEFDEAGARLEIDDMKEFYLKE